MALPKYKQSRASSRMRRAQWFRRLPTIALDECPNCHRKKMAHRGCEACGFYNGKFFKTVKQEAGD